jgi:Tripartite tricarboxylate transporter family receptor
VKRREFITLLGGAVATWPLAALAQQAAMPVFGILLVFSRDSGRTFTEPLRAYMQALGYVEGRNIVFDVRYADGNPSLPMRLIVGFAAGGPTDIAARVIGQWLSDRLGQPFVVENRPGAGSNLATEAAVRAPADGYTLLVGGIPNAVNATLYDKLN